VFQSLLSGRSAIVVVAGIGATVGAGAEVGRPRQNWAVAAGAKLCLAVEQQFARAGSAGHVLNFEPPLAHAESAGRARLKSITSRVIDSVDQRVASFNP
jgi:hypothetical protein